MQDYVLHQHDDPGPVQILIKMQISIPHTKNTPMSALSVHFYFLYPQKKGILFFPGTDFCGGGSLVRLETGSEASSGGQSHVRE